MMNKIDYGETPEFQKDFKRLLKKFRSLECDFELAKIAVIELFHIGIPNPQGVFEKKDIRAIFPVEGFCTEEIQICKIKKFACKALKGKGARSGVRVIYAFHTKILKIVFMEIYYKGNQENDNKKRIEMYLDNDK